MNIVNRYILLYYLRIVGLCSGAFIGIYLLVDFFEKVDRFIDYGATVKDYLSYLGHSIPVVFVQILPLALLTSMVLTLGGLGRTNEMTALRACGLSLWQITRPLIVIILLLCCLLLALNEYLVPWNSRELNQLVDIKLRGREKIRLTHDKIWYRSGSRIIHIGRVDTVGQKLQGVKIFDLDRNHILIRRQEAAIAVPERDRWIAPTVLEHRFTPQDGALVESVTLPNQPLAIDRKIDDFDQLDQLNSLLSAGQLAQLANRLEREGYDATRQWVDFHTRLAAPFTGLVMGLLGIPFALQRGRQSNMALGIGLSLAVGAAYFILQSMIISFGYAGAIPAIAAAWAANLVFIMLAAWLFLGVRQ